MVCEEQGPQLMAAAREHRELRHDFMVGLLVLSTDQFVAFAPVGGWMGSQRPQPESWCVGKGCEVRLKVGVGLTWGTSNCC